jgi:hypothetical protein
MASFSGEVWACFGAVAAAAVISSLYSLALLYKETTTRHDLKIRVHKLRRQYAKRMAEIEAVEYVDLAPIGRAIAPQPVPAEPAKQAA